MNRIQNIKIQFSPPSVVPKDENFLLAPPPAASWESDSVFILENRNAQNRPRNNRPTQSRFRGPRTTATTSSTPPEVERLFRDHARFLFEELRNQEIFLTGETHLSTQNFEAITPNQQAIYIAHARHVHENYAREFMESLPALCRLDPHTRNARIGFGNYVDRLAEAHYRIDHPDLSSSFNQVSDQLRNSYRLLVICNFEYLTQFSLLRYQTEERLTPTIQSGHDRAREVLAEFRRILNNMTSSSGATERRERGPINRLPDSFLRGFEIGIGETRRGRR